MNAGSAATSGSHRPRGRIRLGYGGVVHLLLTGLIITLAVYTQANLLFWAFGLMVAALMVSIGLSAAAPRRIEVQRLLPSHAVAGEQMVIRYRLVNHGRLPVFSLTLTETWGPGERGWRREGPVAEGMLRGRPTGWMLHLGPRQTLQAEAPCWPRRRGELSFQRLTLVSGFPFGVVHKQLVVTLSGRTLVYPPLRRLNRRLVGALSGHEPIGRAHRDRSGGMEDFYGLRAYRQGDSLKMVDWKRTARTGEMISRELTRPSPPRIMVVLDLSGPVNAPASLTDADADADADTCVNGDWALPSGQDRDALVERAVALAASLICEAHLRSFQVGLAVIGARCPNFPLHHSLPHRTRMLEALARLRPSDEPTALPATLPTAPSVLVMLSEPQARPRGERRGPTLVLAASQMERYIRPADHPAAVLLAQRSTPAPSLAD